MYYVGPTNQGHARQSLIVFNYTLGGIPDSIHTFTHTCKSHISTHEALITRQNKTVLNFDNHRVLQARAVSKDPKCGDKNFVADNLNILAFHFLLI